MPPSLDLSMFAAIRAALGLPGSIEGRHADVIGAANVAMGILSHLLAPRRAPGGPYLLI